MLKEQKTKELGDEKEKRRRVVLCGEDRNLTMAVIDKVSQIHASITLVAKSPFVLSHPYFQ